MLLGIRIQNFCIFKDDKAGIVLDDLISPDQTSSLSFSAGITPNIPFSNLLALIGRNATGKSLFFGALSFVSDCTTMGCSTAATQHGRQGFQNLLNNPDGPMNFEFLFMLANGKLDKNGSGDRYVSYQIELSGDLHGRPYYRSEKVILCKRQSDGSWNQTICLDLSDGRGTVYSGEELIPAGVSDKRIPALHSYGAIVSFPILTAVYQEISHWFFCNFSLQKNGDKTTVAPGGHKHLNGDGTNAENVLDYLRCENESLYNSVMEKIFDKIPGTKKVSGKLAEFFKQSPNRLFLYLLLLEDPMPRPLICVETPDMGLYHDMVDVLASEFRQYSVRHPFSQIIFTTHNPYILESMAPNEVWIFKRQEADSWNLVNIECAGAKPIVAEMYRQGVGMGAIWYAGHFDE